MQQVDVENETNHHADDEVTITPLNKSKDTQKELNIDDAGSDEEQLGSAIGTHLEANERSCIRKSNMDGTVSHVSLSKGGYLMVSPPRIERRTSSMLDVLDCAEPSRTILDGHATESQTPSSSKDSSDSHISVEEKYERQYGDDEEMHKGNESRDSVSGLRNEKSTARPPVPLSPFEKKRRTSKMIDGFGRGVSPTNVEEREPSLSNRNNEDSEDHPPSDDSIEFGKDKEEYNEGSEVAVGSSRRRDRKSRRSLRLSGGASKRGSAPASPAGANQGSLLASPAGTQRRSSKMVQGLSRLLSQTHLLEREPSLSKFDKAALSNDELNKEISDVMALQKQKGPPDEYGYQNGAPESSAEVFPNVQARTSRMSLRSNRASVHSNLDPDAKTRSSFPATKPGAVAAATTLAPPSVYFDSSAECSPSEGILTTRTSVRSNRASILICDAEARRRASEIPGSHKILPGAAAISFANSSPRGNNMNTGTSTRGNERFRSPRASRQSLLSSAGKDGKLSGLRAATPVAFAVPAAPFESSPIDIYGTKSLESAEGTDLRSSGDAEDPDSDSHFDGMRGGSDRSIEVVGAVSVSQRGWAIREQGRLSMQPNIDVAGVGRDVRSPIQQEASPAGTSDSWKKSGGFGTRRFFLVLAVIAIVCIAVGVAIPLLNKGSPKDSSKDVIPVETMQKLETISAREDLNTKGSPQSNALIWIAGGDKLSEIDEEIEGEDLDRLVTRYVLAVFYYSLEGQNWIASDGWLDPQKEVCEWKFVECIGNETKTVQAIRVSSRNNLKGVLPSELQHLSGLQRIVLKSNSISGIGGKLGTEIVELDLSQNKLEGGVPTSIFEMSKLERLRLDDNQLTGTLPPHIRAATNLREISMSFNELKGRISVELAPLSSLEVLDLSDNRFTGSFEEITHQLTSLTFIKLKGMSGIAGTLPTEITSFSGLSALWLRGTQVFGTIPTELGSLSNLELLDLQKTQISGSIPTEIGRLSNLVNAIFESTLISGTIPSEIGLLTKLVELDLDSCLKIEGRIPSEIGKLESLENLELENTSLTGSIPIETSNLSNLVSFTLRNTYIKGAVPSGMCGLPSIKKICVGYHLSDDNDISCGCGNIGVCTCSD